MSTDQNQFIPQSHLSIAQLQSQYGILSSTPGSGLSSVSPDIIKPTTVYTYTSSNNGEVVQLGEKNAIFPSANIYGSFDPQMNQQVTYTSPSFQYLSTTQPLVSSTYGKTTLPEYNPYQYAIKQVSEQPVTEVPASEEVVKRSKKNGKGGNSSDSSSDSDNDKKVITELKWSKKKWGKSRILYAKNQFEAVNKQIVSQDAHISQLIKATDLKDQQIQQMSIEINSLRLQGGSSGSSTIVNVQTSQEYLVLQNEYHMLSGRCDELVQDNQQLAQIVQLKEDERSDILASFVLMAAQLDAISSKTSTVLVQSSYNPELELLKSRCADLESQLNKEKMSSNTQANIQIEMVRMQLKDKNEEIDRLQRQIRELQAKQSELIQALESKSSGANQTISTLELKIKDYESQLSILRLQITQAGSANSRIESLEQQLITQTDNLRRKDLEISDLKQRISLLEVQLMSASNPAELESLKRQLREAEGRIAQLQQQLLAASNPAELESVKRSLRQAQDTIAQQQQQLLSASNPAELEQLRRQLQEYESRISQQQIWAEGEIRNREIEIQELRKKCQNYEQQLNLSQQSFIELESLRRALKEYEAKLQALESSKQNSNQNQAQLEELNREIYNLSQQLKIQYQDSSDLRTRCDNLVRQLNEAEGKYQSILTKYEETDYNNKVIIGQNQELIAKIQTLEYQLSQTNVSSTQVQYYESQINQLQLSYFDVLAQYVFVTAALESNSGNNNQQGSIEQYELDLKILRQDNQDLANKSLYFTNLLSEKDNEILRLKANDQSSQITSYQIQLRDMQSKFEQSRNDIIIVAEQVEKMKGFINEKDIELNQWKSKSGNSAYLEGENSRLRMQIKNLEDEMHLAKSDRISQPNNSHQLILQLTQREQDLEENKKRLAAYALKNAELQGEVEVLRSSRGTGDLSTIGSTTDKDQLIHKYRIENKRLSENLQELQQVLKVQQTEIRNQRSTGCGYGCN